MAIQHILNLFLSTKVYPYKILPYSAFSTGFAGVEATSVSWPGPNQETEVTSTPAKPVENVVITTKGLQDRNNQLLDGRTMENKGKLILAIQ